MYDCSDVDAELADQLADRRDEIKALIEGVSGFVAYYLFKTDEGTVSVTVCQDRSGTEEINRMAANWLRRTCPRLASPPEISGEVVIQTGT